MPTNNSVNQTTFNNTLFHDVNYIDYAINNKLMSINTIFPATVNSFNAQNNTATITLIFTPKAVNQVSPQPLQIQNVHVMVISGGNAGVIIQYQPGDIVLCGAVMRDISMIKKAWKTVTGQPSFRKFNLDDTIILGMLSNAPPSINITINNSGIQINGTNQPVAINTSGDVTVNGNNVDVTANADITAKSNTKVTVIAPRINLGGESATVPVVIGSPASSSQFASTSVFAPPVS
jgi:hypothetical protein